MGFPFAQTNFAQFEPAVESKVWESLFTVRIGISDHILMGFMGSRRKLDSCLSVGEGNTQIVRSFTEHIHGRYASPYADERSHVQDTAMFVDDIPKRLFAGVV